MTEIVKHDQDRIMIVDLGPLEGRVEDCIDFIGLHPLDMERKSIII